MAHGQKPVGNPAALSAKSQTAVCVQGLQRAPQLLAIGSMRCVCVVAQHDARDHCSRQNTSLHRRYRPCSAAKRPTRPVRRRHKRPMPAGISRFATATRSPATSPMSANARHIAQQAAGNHHRSVTCLQANARKALRFPGVPKQGINNGFAMSWILISSW